MLAPAALSTTGKYSLYGRFNAKTTSISNESADSSQRRQRSSDGKILAPSNATDEQKISASATIARKNLSRSLITASDDPCSKHEAPPFLPLLQFGRSALETCCLKKSHVCLKKSHASNAEWRVLYRVSESCRARIQRLPCIDSFPANRFSAGSAEKTTNKIETFTRPHAFDHRARSLKPYELCATTLLMSTSIMI